MLAGQHKAGKVSGGRRIYIPGEMSQGLRGKVVVGYVDQTDILPGSSTVREALQFAARLKLPEHVSSEERDRRVEEVIHLLGLDKVADGRIGDDEKRGLSGGERRRLSIGLELIARPSVLFLDEPTSYVSSSQYSGHTLPPAFFFDLFSQWSRLCLRGPSRQGPQGLVCRCSCWSWDHDNLQHSPT